MSRGPRAAQERPQMRSLRMSMVKEKDEELALFLEMRKREKERDDLLLQSSEVLEAPLGAAEQGRSPVFDISSSIPAPARKNYSDEFLNSENDKNDYDWLLTPPGTPLFPSLEIDSPRTVMNQTGTSKPRPVALKSRLANTQLEAPAKSNLSSRQPNPASGLNTSSIGLRRTSSCGPLSRPATPTGRPTLTSSPKSMLTTSKPVPTLPTRSSKPTVTSSSKPSRSSTPTSRATLSSTTKSTIPARPSSPQSRTTARSSTPTTRPTLPASKPPSRSSTPARRTPTLSTVTNTSSVSIKSHSAVTTRPATPTTLASRTTTKNTTQARPSSPTVKSRSWNPSEMPGFSLDAPPNLRTTLPDRPLSATRGRPGAPSSRSSSVEPGNSGRVRRQSCSPSRGRTPNGMIHGCGSSVPAMSRLHAKANDNISPVVIGTKMVERVVNMRKLAPPRQDDKHSPLSNFSGKSSSPDGSGFGRSLSKKSLDMAIRHMDIRRTIPGNLRPLMTNIPASSMYSVRSGHSQSRTVSVSDSPLATSSNASSEMSVNNNSLYPEGNEGDDSVSSSRRCIPSPSRSSVRGR